MLSINSVSFAMENISDKEKELVTSTLENIEIIKKFQNKIWLNYNLSEAPLIYHYENGKAFLFNGLNNKLDGFNPLEYYPSVMVNFNSEKFSFGMGTKNLGKIKAGTFDAGMGFRTLYHEAFHLLYQKNEFLKKRFYDKDISLHDILNSKDWALAEIEQIYLSKAIKEKTEKEIKKNLEIFILIREERNKLQGKELSINEDSLESMEGSAKFVDSLYAGLKDSKEKIKKFDYEHAKVFQENEISNILEKELSKDIFARKRYYFTGSGMGIILEKLNVPNWRKSIEDGFTYFELIKKNINFSSSDTIKLNQIYKSELFIKKESEKKLLLGKDKEELQNFYNSNGHKITITVNEKLNSGINQDFSERYEKIDIEKKTYWRLKTSKYGYLIRKGVKTAIESPKESYSILVRVTPFLIIFYSFSFFKMNESIKAMAYTRGMRENA